MSDNGIGGAGRLTTSLRPGLERLTWLGLLAVTLVTRLYELGHRVMSHDESLHVYYSWKLFAKGEYLHDPMMHGPVLYHATALMYWLFGDSDFSARLFSALMGILLVLSPLLLRKWLGPIGALATGLMLFLSPTIMYYSRYMRHDIHVQLFTVMMVVGFIRYLDSRQGRWIVMALAGGALNIASAEMSYINGFVILVSILVFLVAERLRPETGNLAGLGGVSLGLGLLVFGSLAKHGGLTELLPASLAGRLPAFDQPPAKGYLEASFLFAGLILIFALLLRMMAGFQASDPAGSGDGEVADEDGNGSGSGQGMGLVDLLFPSQAWIFLGLGAVLAIAGRLLHGQRGCAVDASPDVCNVASGLLAAGLVVLIYGAASILLSPKRGRSLALSMGGAPAAATGLALVVFGVIYVLFFTTFFSSVGKDPLQGIDGFKRSIDYWLAQHDVVRGDQPWYYYLLFVPMYEFLPFFFGVAAVWVYWRNAALRAWRGDDALAGQPPALAASLFVPLLTGWMLGAYWTFSWAGEKMPWLIVHMAVPLCFLAGRLIADTVDCIDWAALKSGLLVYLGLLTAGILLLGAQVAALMVFEQGWPVIAFLLSLGLLALLLGWLAAWLRAGRARTVGIILAVLALALLLGWRATVAEKAGELLLGQYDHLFTTLPKMAWAVAAAIGRSLFGIAPALQQADGGSLARGALGLLVAVGVLAAILNRQSKEGSSFNVRLLGALVLAGILAAANLYVSLRANFVNEELATEYIVYAHATDDDNVALERLRDLQKVLKDTQQRDAKIGYDNEVSWPFTWYFRNDQPRSRPDSVPFPGASYLGADAPGLAQLKEYDAVLVGSPNYGKFEDYLDSDFNAYELDRMWWPNEGYKGVTMDDAGLEKVLENFRNPNMRRNLMNILLYRKYVQDPRLPAAEAQAKSLDDWFHNAKMKLWVRKDIDQLGTPVSGSVAPVGTAGPQPTKVDVAQLEVSADLRFEGDDTSVLKEPKGVKVDAAGRVYVLDHGNQRVVVFGPDGKAVATLAEGVLKYQPENADPAPSAWGLGVAPDGSVYVADTWNHRLLKFKDGKETARVGTFGSPPSLSEGLDLLYGPRDVAVDAAGQVYVTDTGNKRVVVLDADLKPLRAFGGSGLGPGELNEPTGIAIDPANGNIVVADLWNERVQVFDKDLRPLRQIPVEGWTSTDANHKAYVAVGPGGIIAFTDPEKSRVWVYSADGKALGRIGIPQDQVGLKMPIGIAFDAEGRLYVVSSESNVVSRFPVLPLGGGDAAAPAAEGTVGDGGDAADGGAATSASTSAATAGAAEPTAAGGPTATAGP